MTPEIAPLAPTNGVCDPVSIAKWDSVANTAGGQVKRQVFHMAERILDVVAKHPQEKHIAGEVHQPAVDEHGGEYGCPCVYGRHYAQLQA